jgi:hypothetical protein
MVQLKSVAVRFCRTFPVLLCLVFGSLLVPAQSHAQNQNIVFQTTSTSNELSDANALVGEARVTAGNTGVTAGGLGGAFSLSFTNRTHHEQSFQRNQRQS